jgi:uncharacterized membrane protein
MHKLLTYINRYAPVLLLLMTAAYALIFSVAALYKFHSLWMGFDLGVHEQVLWNTIHGRIAEISPKGATQSYLGVDIILVEIMLAPLYALLPRTETMLVLQVVLASFGTIPLYRIACDKSGLPLVGLLAAGIYLAALPVQYAILYEFQIRTIGTVLFLWAFLFFERGQFWLFLLAGILAIWTRSDGSFALIAMGGYALVHRRAWYWWVAPVVVGGGWLVLCMQVFIPAFREDHGFLYGFVYAWLGESVGEVLHTLITQPGYVLATMLTAEKLRYLVELFAPLIFLPLLRPDILLIALPSLMLNLLSQEHIHWSIRYHYQAFVIPFLIIATIYAIIDHNKHLPQATLPPDSPPPPLPRRSTTSPLLSRLALSLALLLVIVTLFSQLVLRSPLIHLVTRERDSERIAFAHTLVAHIPDDAAVTVTSAFGSQLARRRELYFFPGNIIYPPAFVERGDYLLVDRHEVPAADVPRLRQIQQSSDWRTLVEEMDFVLLERVNR